MKTKTSRAAKVRAALEAGESVKDIAARFKLKPQTVYTLRWKMNQESKKRRYNLSKLKPNVPLVVDQTNVVVGKTVSRKIGRPKKVLTFNKLKEVADKLTTQNNNTASNFLREELASIERQIDNLHTIASFLTIRLRQMEQNGE